jgi:hypothetical protein
MQTLKITKSPTMTWQFHSHNFDDKGIDCLVEDTVGKCWMKSCEQSSEGDFKMIYEDEAGNDITVDLFND